MLYREQLVPTDQRILYVVVGFGDNENESWIEGIAEQPEQAIAIYQESQDSDSLIIMMWGFDADRQRYDLWDGRRLDPPTGNMKIAVDVPDE